MYKLKARDWWKGLLMAVGVPVLTAIEQSLDAGQFVLNWHLLLKIAIGAFILYMGKNFLTDDEKVAGKIIAESEADKNNKP